MGLLLPFSILKGIAPMSLKDKIAEDLKTAMKSGDKTRLETLRSLRAALMEKEIEKRGGGLTMTGEDELAVLSTSAKKRRESIEQFEKGGRMDLVEQEKRELGVIQEYLPRQMSADEILHVIDDVIAQTGATGPGDLGKLMGVLMKQLKGKADGKLIQELARKKLGV